MAAVYNTPNISKTLSNRTKMGLRSERRSEIPFEAEREKVSNYLAPGEYLVYIENRQPFADADGSTHIARKIRDYISDDVLWYDLLLETNSDGDLLNNPTPITVSADRVLSERSYHEIEPKRMYHFAPLAEGSDYPIQARSFVIKNNLNKPLESTSRSALGSGIYGRYVENENDIPTLLTNPNQSVYRVECPNAYPVQDKEHGESITVASINTNRYMDRILQTLMAMENVDYNSALMLIRINESPILLRLWNIVFYRTEDRITKEWLEDILAKYAVKYLTDNKIVDSVNGESLQELPINDIMLSLEYDGIIASDIYNNGWDRGCVSYNYSQAGVIEGETARY